MIHLPVLCSPNVGTTTATAAHWPKGKWGRHLIISHLKASASADAASRAWLPDTILLLLANTVLLLLAKIVLLLLLASTVLLLLLGWYFRNTSTSTGP